MTKITIEGLGGAHQSVDKHVIEKVNKWCHEAIETLEVTRNRLVARSYIRAALAMLGEGVGRVDQLHEMEITGSVLDDSDFKDLIENAKGLSRKVHEALHEGEFMTAVSYLKSIHRLWGDGEEGSGSLTPRPRDYVAAMSRFNENSLVSPAQERLPSKQQHAEHAHPNHVPSKHH
jgi:hypothetical protein